ncbi:MAG: ABC-type Mn2+/Zn2+ transport system permease subunit [Paraglaciecola sp.]|jgi:ABC-type Mn2+/Zn2+ transport system permease subunit/Mn-dependent DtxR family transcriptional regulator
MLDFFQQFQELYIQRALMASSMVGLMCGVLGCFIVLRNMALIGDALAHSVLPGVVVAFILVGHNPLAFFIGSVIAGLATSVGITWIQHNARTKNDAAIGIVFTAMFAIGVIGISKISRRPGVHLDLNDFLFGDVLGVANEDLYLTGAVLVYVLISVVVFYRYLFAATFQPIIAETMGISVKTIHYFLMLLLSFAVVASLKSVGLILVVAMLITPASTALLLSNRLHWVVFMSGIIGLISAVLGLVIAIILDITPAPTMAVVATLLYLLAVFFAPDKGVIPRFLQRRKLQRKIQLEDILKQTFRLQQKGLLNSNNLLNNLGFGKAILNKQLKYLKSKGLFAKQQLALTHEGKEEAKRLVRAHRLWETYLVDQLGLTEDQIHEAAEKYEHLLTDEILDEVDATLGFPMHDPHGSPIPTKRGLPDFPLSHLDLSKLAKIAKDQNGEQIYAKLWQLGLLPDAVFSVVKKVGDVIFIEQNGKEIQLSGVLARQVNVEV